MKIIVEHTILDGRRLQREEPDESSMSRGAPLTARRRDGD
jgi:hypothetical protein